MKTIFAAIAQGDVDAVRRILAEDPSQAAARDAKGIPALRQAYYHQRADLVQAVLAADPPLDVFDLAALGRGDELRRCLADNPSLANAWTTDGFSVLHQAAFFGSAEVVRVLIEAGADVNAVSREAMGVRPLQSATAAGAAESIALLESHGAVV